MPWIYPKSNRQWSNGACVTDLAIRAGRKRTGRFCLVTNAWWVVRACYNGALPTPVRESFMYHWFHIKAPNFFPAQAFQTLAWCFAIKAPTSAIEIHSNLEHTQTFLRKRDVVCVCFSFRTRFVSRQHVIAQVSCVFSPNRWSEHTLLSGCCCCVVHLVLFGWIQDCFDVLLQKKQTLRWFDIRLDCSRLLNWVFLCWVFVYKKQPELVSKQNNQPELKWAWRPWTYF